jgi:hypothetical protein
MLALLAAALAGPLQPAHANTWNCADSYWDFWFCWPDGTVPTSADDILVAPVGSSDTLLEIDELTGAAEARSRAIDSPSTGSTVGLQQTGGSLLAAEEYIGDYGTGTFTRTGGSKFSIRRSSVGPRRLQLLTLCSW